MCAFRSITVQRMLRARPPYEGGKVGDESKMVAAVLIACSAKFGRYLADSDVPVDRLEAAVVTPPQRLRDTIWRILVVIDARRLLAQLAFRAEVRVIAADFRDATAVVAELGFDTAVVLTQHAGGGLLVGDVHPSQVADGG